MRKEYLLLGFILFVLLLAIAGIVYSHPSKITLVKVEPNSFGIPLQKDYILGTEKIEQIEEIAREVANSHEYKLNSYDCTDFSSELVKRLKEKGYKAQCTGGYYNLHGERFGHTWVSLWIENQRVEIESTKGYFIDENEFKNYEIEIEGYCW